jgi:Zn-dependent protease with chaperone function
MAQNSSLVPTRHKLEGIDSRTWEHPADRGALAALRAIPGFDEVLKKLIGAFGERGVRLAFQADAVRVSAKQFPRLHRLWLGVLDTLDSPEQYDLYIAQSPVVNAGAFGVERPWVVLLSGSLRLLSDEEIESVMGHELGHVLSGHALYHTMLEILLQLAASGFPLVGMAAMPILLALMEWYRKSELSADRAGLLAVQKPGASLNSLMRLAGGGFADEMDLNEFLAQAEEYRANKGVLDQVMKVLNTLRMTHPFLVMRAALLRDWIEEGAYDRVLRGEYPRRTEPRPDWKDDVREGVRHYTGGVSDTAERAGQTLRSMREAFERGFKGAPEQGEPF